MNFHTTLCLVVVVILCGCGGSSHAPPAGSGNNGGTSSHAQHATMTIVGDTASAIEPYVATIEVDYDSNSVPTFRAGTCVAVYDPTGSENDVADTTKIQCSAAIPSIDGPADAGSGLPVPPSTLLTILLKGRPSTPLEVDVNSASLVSLGVSVVGGHHIWSAGLPAGPSQQAPSDFSFQIDSAKALPLPYAGFLYTNYILEASGHVTTSPNPNIPGTATVTLNMSANSLANPTDGGADSSTRLGTATCADLLACCGVISDSAAKSSCISLATLYQGMVGHGLSQDQADFDCDAFLRGERTATLCP